MAEQREDQEKGAVLIAVNSYWNNLELRLPYSDRVLKGYIETFHRYLFFHVDVVVEFTVNEFNVKLKQFTKWCRQHGMNRIAVVLYGHGGIVGGKEVVLTHDLKTLTIVELEEELHIQLPDDNKYLFIDACRKSFSNPPQAYVLQANTDRTTVIRSILLFKTAISNAWSECFAMNLRKQAALSNVVRNVDDNMKQYYTKFVKRVSRIPEDEGDQKSEILSKGTSDDPNFRGEARASNQDRIRQLTLYLQNIIKVAEETFTTGRAQFRLPPKPNLSFLEGPPDDRSNLTGPGFALSSAQADQLTMPPSTTAVEDQRTRALREVHENMKWFYTSRPKCKTPKQFINLALVERPSKVDKTKKNVKEFLEETAHGIDQYSLKKENFEYLDILTSTGSDSGKRVLISGSPGSGKTTLAHQLCRDLYSGRVPNQYQLVLFTELKTFGLFLSKKNKEASLLTLLEYLYDHTETDSLCSMIKQDLGRGVAIILDGYDEISDDSCKTSLTEWVSEVFCGKRFSAVSGCDVFITTRPSQLSQLATNASAHLEILGFSSRNIECYIQDYFKDSPDTAKKVNRRLTSLPLVRGLCSNPRVLEIACKMIELDEEPLPANLSGIFLRYVCNQLEVDLTQRQPPVETVARIKDLLSVPKEHFPGFYPLCSLAYMCCLRQQLILEKQELGEVKKFINNGESVYNLLFGKAVNSTSSLLCMLYQCDHKTVMEALAAVHIAVLPKEEQQRIWEKYLNASSPHMTQVWMMYCGLTGLKSVDLRRLCSLTVSERNREVVKDLKARRVTFKNVSYDNLMIVSLFEASNNEEAKRVLPFLFKNTIQGNVRGQHDVLCLAYSITHHPHLSRVRLSVFHNYLKIDCQPLTTSLKNVRAVHLSWPRFVPVKAMLTLLPRSVEDLSLDLCVKGCLKGLGGILIDHLSRKLRSLTFETPLDSALWTEMDSVLTNTRLKELHLKSMYGVKVSTGTLKNLLVHREKFSLEMTLDDYQLSALLFGLKGADKLKELALTLNFTGGSKLLVTCADVKELVAKHPHLVKVNVENNYKWPQVEKSELLIAVAKGAIENKNITHLGLGEDETRAVHPLLCSPSAKHITSIRAVYSVLTEGLIEGPMARQTCHLDLRGFTPASLGLLLSRAVNPATELKHLCLEISYPDLGEDQNSVDVHAVKTAFSKCKLRKLRILHSQLSKPLPSVWPKEWYLLYSAILDGLAANNTCTAQVDSCISGHSEYFNIEEIRGHLSEQTKERLEVVEKGGWSSCIISWHPSSPAASGD